MTHTSSLFTFCSFATLGMGHILSIRSSMDRHCFIANVPMGRSAPMRLDRPVNLSGAHAWRGTAGTWKSTFLVQSLISTQGCPSLFGEKRHIQVVSLHLPNAGEAARLFTRAQPPGLLGASEHLCRIHSQHPGGADIGPRGATSPSGAGPSLSKPPISLSSVPAHCSSAACLAPYRARHS